MCFFFLPSGNEGKGELTGPAKGAEPADWGSPQGASWNPGPFGPPGGRTASQGRGPVRGPPAAVFTGAGNSGGLGMKYVSLLGLLYQSIIHLYLSVCFYLFFKLFLRSSPSIKYLSVLY